MLIHLIAQADQVMLLAELRDFFGAFFILPFKQWGGFLSHR